MSCFRLFHSGHPDSHCVIYRDKYEHERAAWVWRAAEEGWDTMPYTTAANSNCCPIRLSFLTTTIFQLWTHFNYQKHNWLCPTFWVQSCYHLISHTTKNEAFCKIVHMKWQCGPFLQHEKPPKKKKFSNCSVILDWTAFDKYNLGWICNPITCILVYFH